MGGERGAKGGGGGYPRGVCRVGYWSGGKNGLGKAIDNGVETEGRGAVLAKTSLIVTPPFFMAFPSLFFPPCK